MNKLNFIRRIVSRSGNESENLKRLGFSENSRLLIIHADDMGLSHLTNFACIKALEQGLVTSASIMIPCPYAYEAINYSKINKDKDIGIHLTLTSEWTEQKCSPILGNKVSSLTDSDGFFFQTCEELEKRATLPQVELEWRAQIEMALINGMRPTHLDCHMFSGLINQNFLKIYVRLGRIYGLPVLLNRRKIKKWFHYDLKRYISDKEILVDQLFIATPNRVKKGHAEYYRSILQNLNPGLNCLLIHPAFDDIELRSITKGHENYNSAWRQADLNFFTGLECEKIIWKNDIKLISWREINNRMEKNQINSLVSGLNL